MQEVEIIMNPSAEKKVFTVDEANRTLPLVSVIVQDIVQLFQDVHDRRERLSHIRQMRSKGDDQTTDAYSEEVEQAVSVLNEDIERLDDFINELSQLGAELKDPILGLVDFPCIYEGREICLCWKLGEESIDFWHETDTGFQGRQPVATLTSEQT